VVPEPYLQKGEGAVKLTQYKYSTYNIKDLKLIAMAKVAHIYGNYARIIMAECRRWSMEVVSWFGSTGSFSRM